MTYTIRRYKSYQEYLDDDELYREKNYRLLDTGELIEVASEDDLNIQIANRLIAALLQVMGINFIDFIRNGNREIQVNPLGDRWVNRKPDLMVIRPSHLETARQAIKLGDVPPVFVSETVSPGGEYSDSYLRDYVWKRQQYQDLGISEYWIVDPQRIKVTVLILVEGEYQELVYVDDDKIVSAAYPAIALTADELLFGTHQRLSSKNKSPVTRK